MSTRAVPPLLLALALSACSSDPELPVGPTGDEMQGAVNLEIYSTMEQDCPLGNVHVDFGNTKVEPPEVLYDGFESVTIDCSVKAEAGGIVAGASFSKAGSGFAFSEVKSSGASSIGQVTVTTESGEYRSGAAKPCIFQFAPGTAQTIQPGKAFMQFDCTELVKVDDPSKACSSRYGYVYVDRCDK